MQTIAGAANPQRLQIFKEGREPPPGKSGMKSIVRRKAHCRNKNAKEGGVLHRKDAAFFFAGDEIQRLFRHSYG